MKSYFVEAVASRDGCKERCQVWAQSPQEAARMAADYLPGFRVEYIWQLPGPSNHPAVNILLSLPQWNVKQCGNDFILN